MKSKLLFLSFLMLLTVTTNYAQSSAEQAGIAVQGIARDVNNTAIASTSISFTFELYYLNTASAEVSIYTITENLQTDAFGVFSYIIEANAVNNEKFANYQAYLRIKMGNDIISNEKLKHVPYAISANNGVPTGSIMPFIGTAAPYGWALCNGAALPSTATELRAMVGTNAPNLQGMFLRGTGTSPVNSQAGPGLKATQVDAIKSHNPSITDPSHGHGITDPGHGHAITDPSHAHATQQSDNTDDGTYFAGGTAASRDAATRTAYTGISINSASTGISLAAATTGISAAYSGAGETRPVNYGVHYIIKL
jgi:hypothetical protein